ncbi:response regulator transcription factor [Novosphingobium mangrovi (ex Huang et al. 2023)]|uniref:Response regulator transcription factor n=1 Tax=Novosphingobium mangrovi (ex Huang et al. 2023) TaxID=2976432 RepID=A0ABT2I975_9SPHN|nr:response regulator transcription factor [Novosphingobium mangrovi (ex Huang et al. 2023)]MCT2401369.1 response regulator transcription factor [Novosphingobium mangrovi (ex Huang et al. 2023)]
MRVLLVEDDEQLASRLSDRLRGAGFAVDVARGREDGEAWPDMDKMAAIILDLGLPDGSGMDLLAYWRDRKVDCPILILTARGSWQDKVSGLNAGADDFVVKPVRFEELLARLHALLRRQGGSRDTWIENAGLRLDPIGGDVERDGQPVSLSKQEFRLLNLFMRRPGQVLSQVDIVEQLYDLDSHRDPNAVEVLVSRLRRKIGGERIQTLRGLGYRFGK